MIVFIHYFKLDFLADILEEFEKNLNRQIETECIGGGRILHNSAKKEILVYGYSQVIRQFYFIDKSQTFNNKGIKRVMDKLIMQ